ncbi:hypothetical protein CHX26_03675 [Porphyrobacter sp. HT-58-2]|uniref:hypothetical protein n=1 Tax=Porphyrobacter sp. HT-58-2 TaxID=2023229 RepID=UPI000CDCCEA8|nr:hypothetical protein [Porphyrobacter sp. HT-58-2]AUX68726.1 hypothetical protein CHX26_03675 [Porphyrobacter sp. HT-58-2]
MTAHDDPSATKAGASIARSLGIVALFGLAGPVVGGVTVAILSTLLAVFSDLASGDPGAVPKQVVGGLIAGSIFAVILGYAIGTVPALGVGIVVAWRDRRARGVSVRTAVLAGLGFWIASAIIVVISVPVEGRLVWIAALLAAHLAGAAGCGWLARRLLG